MPQMAITIVERPAQFAQAGPLDSFIEYVATIMPRGVVAWMHVTSPFFDAAEIDRAVDAYRSAAEAGTADSLMGVSRIQTFLWDETGCVSHDRARVKWPQTQDLRSLYEVNSTIFLIEKDLMRRLGDRISERVLLHEVERRAAFDVDWPADFEFVAKALSAEP
jgi:CMP-N-acetylneuraminic acid synthetase